jgi:hypothetical protein
MFSLLVGFLTSGLPHVLDFFKQRQADSSELERMKVQAQIAKDQGELQERLAIAAAKAASDQADADAFRETQKGANTPLAPPPSTGIKWIDALDDLLTVLINAFNASVRPGLAYTVTLAFLSITACQVYAVWLKPEWSPMLAQTMALGTVAMLVESFGLVIGLYFGDRGFRYALGKMSAG